MKHRERTSYRGPGSFYVVDIFDFHFPGTYRRNVQVACLVGHRTHKWKLMQTRIFYFNYLRR
jgi:hypothetical protein